MHVVVAPGRLNVIGEHVDYNQGIVLPAAIERWVVGAFMQHEDDEVVLYDAKYDKTASFDPNGDLVPEKGSWLNYPKGVCAQFRKLGARLPGFKLCMISTIPNGGGLSSSAALEALFATAIETLLGMSLPPLDKALLCQRAEHEFAGVPCGIMDQVAVIMGQDNSILKLDCRDLSVETVGFADPNVSLLVIDSKVKHKLADGAYAKRRKSCEEACEALGVTSLRDITREQLTLASFSSIEHYNRALHVVDEMARTITMVEALKHQNYSTAGQLMRQSHDSLRDLYEVSCPELDFLADLCNGTSGVFGARMMGGGFGGSVIVLLEQISADALVKKVEEAYQKQFGLSPTAFITRPSQGVETLSLV